MQTRLLAVNGSFRKNSHTRKLLAVVLDAAAASGAEVRLLDLAEHRLPMYDPDGIDVNPIVDKTRELVLWANAFVLGSPDHHGSMSAPITNFLSFFWHEFTGKLFGYVCASHEKGLTVMDQMRTAVRQCYGWSLPYGIGFNGDEAFNKDGSFADERIAHRAGMLGCDLAKYGALLYSQFEADLCKSPRDPGFAERFKG